MHRQALTLLFFGLATTCTTRVAGPPAEGVCDHLQVACGPACFDLSTSREHCGACGNQCAESAVCVDGACTLTCSSDTVLCHGTCFDLKTSVEHCGACGGRCDGGEHSLNTCEDGVCVYGCEDAYRDCNDSLDDGCEQDVALDADNCGACGRSCLGGAHAEAACDNEICVLGTCSQDFGNCDEDPSTGCETSLRTSNQHCGECDVPCSDDLQCVSGACKPIRPHLLLCGTSSHDVSDFLPDGVSLTIVTSCDADEDTQAMLITRTGTFAVDASNLNTYVQAGGIVITERGNADEVFSLLFSPVAQGFFAGSCADNIATVTQYSPDDPFWIDNAFTTMNFSQTGCGWDIGAYPGVVPIAGWSPQTVSLGYRNLGVGRVWLVEADWQDAGLLHTQQTRRLMGYMMLSR